MLSRIMKTVLLDYYSECLADEIVSAYEQTSQGLTEVLCDFLSAEMAVKVRNEITDLYEKL